MYIRGTLNRARYNPERCIPPIKSAFSDLNTMLGEENKTTIFIELLNHTLIIMTLYMNPVGNYVHSHCLDH